MAKKDNTILLIAGLVGVGAFFLYRKTEEEVIVEDTGGLGQPVGGGGLLGAGDCVTCNWPTPIPFGKTSCPGCLHSPVVPFPFHFAAPWFFVFPVPPPVGFSGYSVPAPGGNVELIPPAFPAPGGFGG